MTTSPLSAASLRAAPTYSRLGAPQLAGITSNGNGPSPRPVGVTTNPRMGVPPCPGMDWYEMSAPYVCAPDVGASRVPTTATVVSRVNIRELRINPPLGVAYLTNAPAPCGLRASNLLTV